MRPFGWVPEWPTWSIKAASRFPEAVAGGGVAMVAGKAVQRVNSDWVAVLDAAPEVQETASPADDFSFEESLEGDAGLAASSAHDTWSAGLDVGRWWPDAGVANLDMDPSLSPQFLADQYEETLLGSTPLALFPKQVLPKARMGMTMGAYAATLARLLQAPAEIDAKYRLGEGENTQFLETVRSAVDGQRPLTVVVGELRARDTQLQLIVCLELLSLLSDEGHKGVQPEASLEDLLGSAGLETTVDLHFDRLCIWQAVGGSGLVDDFCASILIPFFKVRVPRKTKHLVRVSRGTLRTRHRPARGAKSIAGSQPAAGLAPAGGATTGTSAATGAGASVGTARQRARREALPRASAPAAEPSPATGLLKALQMRNLVLAPEPAPAASSLRTEPDVKRRTCRASRSVSHPVYSQQLRHDQVEVRFKNTRSREAARPASTGPSRAATPADAAEPPVPAAPRAAPSRPSRSSVAAAKKARPQSDVVEATPTKIRSVYLESLPQPRTLFEDDGDEDDAAIGSTDSDE